MTGKHDVNLPSKVVYVVRYLPQIKLYYDFWFIEWIATLYYLYYAKNYIIRILEILILFIIILIGEQNQIHAFVMSIISDKIFGNLKWNDEIPYFLFHVTTLCHNIWHDIYSSNWFLGSTSPRLHFP